MPKKPPKSTLIATSSSLSLKAAIPAFLSDPAIPLPKLIVFDLDYTLWPFWIDTHVTPPLKPNSTHTSASDKFGEEYTFYGDVPGILITLLQQDVKLGVASRTCAPGLAKDLLKMVHLTSTDGKVKKSYDVFDAGLEIYPSSKIKHFEALQKRTGLRYEDMLFFDDEARNRDTESLGVTMWLVRDGVTWGEIEKGVQEWRKRRGYTKN